MGLTNLRLNLYVVEDSLEFPYKPTDTATLIPGDYSFDFSKVSRALNHSTVRLSWDQTDPKRMSKLQANYRNLMKKKANEINLSDEEAAYKDLIAGSSSDEENELSEDEDGGSGADNEERSKKRIEEMRQKLLGNLASDKPANKL